MASKNQVYIDVVIDDKGTTKRIAVDAKKLGMELDKAGSATEKTTKGTDKLSKSNKDLDRNMRGAAKMSAHGTKEFSKMQQGMGGLVGAYATLAAQVFAVSAAFQFLQTASDYRNLIAGQEALGAVRRVYDILDTQPEIKNPENPIPLSKIEGNIRFENVSFDYQEGVEVLKQVSFDILPGQTIALVGPSGAGKSTLIQLLHRFFDPNSGSVQIEGIDIRELDRSSFLSQIALVPQETLLFGGTVRENILYGKLDATFAELVDAAKSAHAHEFISKLKNGYDTPVGEKGVKLSGGERQRIAIARALLKNPKILVLDEATSALDNQSEYLIQEALDRLMVNRTTLVIAHRLSTVHNADKIIVLDQGRVVEMGNHKELMVNENLYYHLYTLKMIETQTSPARETFGDTGMALSS